MRRNSGNSTCPLTVPELSKQTTGPCDCQRRPGSISDESIHLPARDNRIKYLRICVEQAPAFTERQLVGPTKTEYCGWIGVELPESPIGELALCTAEALGPSVKSNKCQPIREPFIRFDLKRIVFALPAGIRDTAECRAAGEGGSARCYRCVLRVRLQRLKDRICTGLRSLETAALFRLQRRLPR